MDFLSHFRVLFDYPAQRLYLAPVASKAMFPTVAARTNGAQKVWDVHYAPTEKGEWSVIKIDGDGIFARSDLRAGDIVVEVNGHKADGLLRDEFAATFAETRAIKLRVLRDGKDVSVSTKK